MNLARVFPPPSAAARETEIDLIFFDAGGGHRASATALKALAEQEQRGWQVRMVNLRDILEPIDVFHRLTGVRVEDLYNRMLKYGLTIGTGPMLRAVQFLIRRMHPRNVALLARYWQERRPDLVVSLIPNFNRAIFEGLRIADRARSRPATPMVTILTDLADCPPHFWIERQEQYLICGTAKAAEQALAMGYPPTRVLRTSGMIVRPEFYRRPEISREQERRRIGLRPDVPTGLVMFGGFGSRRMLTIARRVAEAGVKTQLIFLCGHNQRLREQLSAMKLPFPCHVLGFTRDIPHLMQLSDYFVGKPGPGSVSEALVMDLPVIVERNARTMVQERYNTEWIERHQFGMVLRSFNEIVAGIAQMLDPQRLAHFRSRVRALNNRAVFEIPDLLEALIAAAPGESAPAAFQALA
jgi:1,2-diacylglycerol 3-beta-galactosyltransferase